MTDSTDTDQAANQSAVDQAATETEQRSGARVLSGAVVSDRMDKTVTVLVERSVKHPVYGKILRRRSKVHAHDEHNECRMGDLVTIVETRPISKLKSWRLQSIDRRTASEAVAGEENG